MRGVDGATALPSAGRARLRNRRRSARPRSIRTGEWLCTCLKTPVSSATPVNLRLLLAYAREAGKEIALVSLDEGVVQAASAYGPAVFASAEDVFVSESLRRLRKRPPPPPADHAVFCTQPHSLFWSVWRAWPFSRLGRSWSWRRSSGRFRSLSNSPWGGGRGAGGWSGLWFKRKPRSKWKRLAYASWASNRPRASRVLDGGPSRCSCRPGLW